MSLHKILRALAILAYLSIYLNGDIIKGPFIVLMLFAFFNADIETQILIALAYSGLITLALFTFIGKNNWTFFIELVICFLLTLPIINELTFEPSQLLHYPMFIIPTSCFLLLYILSMYFSYAGETKTSPTKSI